MADIELINDGSYEFIDISGEEWRRYEWGDGREVFIQDPQWLAISDSGHRVLSGDGVSHYIPFGWVHLYWRSSIGKPHYVK